MNEAQQKAWSCLIDKKAANINIESKSYKNGEIFKVIIAEV